MLHQNLPTADLEYSVIDHHRDLARGICTSLGTIARLLRHHCNARTSCSRSHNFNRSIEPKKVRLERKLANANALQGKH